MFITWKDFALVLIIQFSNVKNKQMTIEHNNVL